MHPIIEQHRPQIEAACRKYGVTRLEVFGSVARGDDFNAKRSDIDFLAEFQRPSPMSASDQYFGFLFALEDTLIRKIDIVEMAGVTNPYLRQSIERDKTLVYESRSAEIPG